MRDEDAYFRGFQEGLREQRERSAALLDKWRPDPAWRAYEVQRAAARIVRDGRLPDA